MAAIFIHFHSHKSLILLVIHLPYETLPETASQLRSKKVVPKAITRNLKGTLHLISKWCLMQLYEIYQNIVLGTSITCIIGLAVAWVLFLSNRNK